mmetsp:Transcript_23532/g.33008  ORF Transcript_23532/g.33008 Transcript_23532/m.33008 type:complete len:349 (-) Transcript_23532:10-1056(-)
MTHPVEHDVLEHLDDSDMSSDDSSIDSDESDYYSSDTDSSFISNDADLMDELIQTSGVQVIKDISRSCHVIGRSEMQVTEVSGMLQNIRLGSSRRGSKGSSGNLSLPDNFSTIVPENIGCSESGEKNAGIKRNTSSATVNVMTKRCVTITASVVDKSASNDENPTKVLMEILKDAGHKDLPIPSMDVPGFFVDISEERIQHYSSEIVKAVQNADLKSLGRLHHKEGRRLDCCNKFGESVVHIACRRGHADVLEYLLEEANIDVRVKDDYGRTPAHDACWAPNPNTDLMLMLINECPDLLYFSDKRGNTPMEYVRKEHWMSWCAFLRRHADDLLPKSPILLGRTEQAGR